MNILVLDVAASTSGALTILEQYYTELQADTENHYFFCIGTPELQSTGNVTILRFPWVKKSWLHRLWFELLWVSRLVREHQIDRVFSLENLILRRPPCPQWIYLHQSLPYAEYRFGLRENPKLWVYQNIIGRLIGHSLKRAEHIIVQTKWVRDAIVQRHSLDPIKVTVTPPGVDEGGLKPFVDSPENRRRFFYPSTPFPYKNHQTVLDALVLLPEESRQEIQVVFTLSGEENDYSRGLKAQAERQNLPVKFVGYLSKAEVQDYYSCSVLLFPSVIESHPMPLKEARLSGCPVLASDCAFAREILEGYEQVSFFGPMDAKKLAEHMEKATDV